MKGKNTVAKIFKISACLFAVLSIIAFLILLSSSSGYAYGHDNSYGRYSFICLTSGLLGSLFLYGFGEIIELLQSIKDNTNQGKDNAMERPQL